MADRVHPRNSSTDEENPTPNYGSNISDTRPMLEKTPPPQGAYVVQLPRDQVYGIPPPRPGVINESRKLRRSRGGGGCFCRCFCCLISFIVVLAILIGIAALVFYLVVKPTAPTYSVDSVSISGFNTTQLATSQTLSPEFDVTISADNSNTKIGIYYDTGSSVAIYHSNLELVNGTLPVFYQPTQNVTTFDVSMTGSVPLTTSLASSLGTEVSAGKIPLVLDIDVPAKLKIGAITTWQFTVKVNCNIVVSSLSADSNIVSKSCTVNLQVF